MNQKLKKTLKLKDTKRYGVFEDIEKIVQPNANIYETIKPIYKRVDTIISEPLKLAVLGEYNAGKSTFINRLLDAKILPVGPTPKTATTITLIFYDNPKENTKYKVESIYERGDGSLISREEFAKDDDEMYSLLAKIQNSAKENKDINYMLKEIKAYVKNDILKVFHIVDTPGFNDVPNLSKTSEFIFDKVNYVIWLFGTQSGTKTEKEIIGNFLEKTPYQKNIYAIFNYGDALVSNGVASEYDKVLNEKIDHLGDFKSNFANNNFFLISSLKKDDSFWDTKFKELLYDLEKVVLDKDEDISAEQLEMELKKLNEILTKSRIDLSNVLTKVQKEFNVFFETYNLNNYKRIDVFKEKTLNTIKKGVKDTEKKVQMSEFINSQYGLSLLKFTAYYYTAEKLKDMKESIEDNYKSYIEAFELEFANFRKQLVSQQVTNETLRDVKFFNNIERKMDELSSNLKVKKNSEQLLIVGYIIGLLSDDYIYSSITNMENRENINEDPIINLLNMDLDLTYFLNEIDNIKNSINDKLSNEIKVLNSTKQLIRKYIKEPLKEVVEEGENR